MRDWESCYRNGDTPWDKGAAAPPLADLLDRWGAAIFKGGPVLVPGCGLGHDVRWLAENGVPALGVDLAASAVDQARALTRCETARFEQGDFLDPAWCDGRSFPALWEHTCFCAIDPALRGAYARAAAALLEPGGHLSGVFYQNPASPGADGGPPFGVTVAELDALFAPWFESVWGVVPARAYPGREGREWLALYRRLPAGHA